MNRRDFLKAIAALPAAAAVPAWVQPLPQWWGKSIVAMLKAEQAVLNEAYTAFLHPSVWFDLRRLVALDAWRAAYREWRINRREGGSHETLQALMARVKASVEADEVFGMKEGLGRAMVHGEVGSYQGFRMIVSDTVHT